MEFFLEFDDVRIHTWCVMAPVESWLVLAQRVRYRTRPWMCMYCRTPPPRLFRAFLFVERACVVWVLSCLGVGTSASVLCGSCAAAAAATAGAAAALDVFGGDVLRC